MISALWCEPLLWVMWKKGTGVFVWDSMETFYSSLAKGPKDQEVMAVFEGAGII